MKRWRGLKSLVVDAVEHGSRAIERVQIETAKRPFDILEQLPMLKVPVNGVRAVYNMSVSSTHGMVRLVNKVAGDTVDAALDAISTREGGAAADGAESSGGAPVTTQVDGAESSGGAPVSQPKASAKPRPASGG